MAKKGKSEPKQVASKHITTRRVARWQKEKRRQRITFFSGVAVILIVIGIIVGGVFASKSNDWLSKVKTNAGTITLKKTDYANELKLLRLYNSSVSTNDSPLVSIEDAYLIKDEAKAVGLNISETEIDNRTLTSFGMENTSISDTAFQTKYKNTLSTYNISDKEFRDNLELSLLYTKLLDYFVNDSPKSAPESGEQAAVETIEANSSSVASEIAQRWRNGESYENLSQESGIQGHQAGFIVKGTIMSEAFDNVAFSIDIGNVSDPIPSDTGYDVIMVTERTNGTVTDAQRQSIGQTLYYKWLAQARKDDVERNPKLNIDEIYAWALKN